MYGEEDTTTYEKLHLRDLLVDFFHEFDDEVHQLMFQHLLGVEISNQEGDVIALTAPLALYGQAPLVHRGVR